MKPEINARCLSQSVFILLLRQNLSLNFQLTVIARLNDWCASGICVSLSSRLGLDIYCAALYRVLGINFASWAISVFRWPFLHLLISSPLNSITWTWKAKSLSCRARNTRRAQVHAAQQPPAVSDIISLISHFNKPWVLYIVPLSNRGWY